MEILFDAPQVGANLSCFCFICFKDYLVSMKKDYVTETGCTSLYFYDVFRSISTFICYLTAISIDASLVCNLITIRLFLHYIKKYLAYFWRTVSLLNDNH